MTTAVRRMRRVQVFRRTVVVSRETSRTYVRNCPRSFGFVITQYYTNLTPSQFKLLKRAVCFPLRTLPSLFLSVKMEIMAAFFFFL